MKKTVFRRQYLYVIPSETPGGFKYSSYSNVQPNFGKFCVNLMKYGRR